METILFMIHKVEVVESDVISIYDFFFCGHIWVEPATLNTRAPQSYLHPENASLSNCNASIARRNILVLDI